LSVDSFVIIIFEHLYIEFYKEVAMNHLLRLMMVGLLVVACVWGTQLEVLHDTEILSPDLSTNQELNVKLEGLVEQPEIYQLNDPLTYIRVFLSQAKLSGPPELNTDILSDIASRNAIDPHHKRSYNYIDWNPFTLGICLVCVILTMLGILYVVSSCIEIIKGSDKIHRQQNKSNV
jgi:hypothetical protein